MTTWGNEMGELEFRRRRMEGTSPGDGAWVRLWIGLGAVLALALVYPFYDYTVKAKLAERDLREATRQMQAQLKAAGDAITRDVRLQQVEQRQQTMEQRLAAVRVRGVSDSGGVPTVMVELQGLTAVQAALPICTQVRTWLRRPTDGMALRIQAARGNRPAQDAGTIRCG